MRPYQPLKVPGRALSKDGRVLLYVEHMGEPRHLAKKRVMNVTATAGAGSAGQRGSSAPPPLCSPYTRAKDVTR